MKTSNLLFRLSVLFFFISSFSVIFTFWGDYNGTTMNYIFALMTGILFWGGLILGIIFIALVNSKRKEYEKRNNISNKKKVGAFSFFSNKPAFISDVLMILFFVLTLLFLFVPFFSKSIALINISIFLFALYCHCMFNGRNYIYIKNI